MKATQKNLLMLTRLEERMADPSGQALRCERVGGRPALTSYDLGRGERYHAERLAKLGFLKKTRATAPWYGSQPVTLYWRDESCHANPFPWRGMTNHRMQEKLVAGEAVDLSGCPRETKRVWGPLVDADLIEVDDYYSHRTGESREFTVPARLVHAFLNL
ncbi:MAG TPA: hypothetical protein VK039_06390, partial [Brevibacterium sp.]|nr:hypothetical protein [Brevibacterium sp.]